MNLSQMRTHYRRLKPYSNQDYLRDAKSIIIDRIITGRFDHSALYTKEIMDPSHAAQWSVLSRKRKSGFMLLALYEISIRYDLDMTMTLGTRILQGIFGSSISNAILLQAFPHPGRTASDRSADWDQVDQIVKDNKTYYQEKIKQSKARIAANKDLSWELVRLDFAAMKAR